jgi:hypothetical protein
MRGTGYLHFTGKNWVNIMPEDEGIVDGCFLTWVQVTDHFRDQGKITEKTKNFREAKH